MKRKAAAAAPEIKTRGARVANKEQAIIAAARQLFHDEGFAKTTMAGIARTANVADGTLYLYFESKEALARAVLEVFYDELTQDARAGVTKCETTEERLEFLARHHLKNIIAERRLLELIVILDQTVEGYADSEFYRLNKTYVSVFDGVMKEAVFRGDINEHSPLWVQRDLFYGGLDYAMRTIMLKRRRGDIGIAAKGIVESILRSQATMTTDEDSHSIPARLEAAVTRLEKLAKKRKA